MRSAWLRNRVGTAADKPDIAFHKQLDERLTQITKEGIVVDLILSGANEQLRQAFPSAPQRERFIRYMVSRYSAFNITWQLTEEFESYTNGRELMKQLGVIIKNLDPYGHPRTAHTNSTSAPLLPDGWMDHVLYRSSSSDLESIEPPDLCCSVRQCGIWDGGQRRGKHR